METRELGFLALGQAIVLFALILAVLIVGGIKPVQVNSPPPLVGGLDPAYCESVGDDNCDGIVMDYESGWKCVPPNGGPLLC